MSSGLTLYVPTDDAAASCAHGWLAWSRAGTARAPKIDDMGTAFVRTQFSYRHCSLTWGICGAKKKIRVFHYALACFVKTLT